MESSSKAGSPVLNNKYAESLANRLRAADELAMRTRLTSGFGGLQHRDKIFKLRPQLINYDRCSTAIQWQRFSGLRRVSQV